MLVGVRVAVGVAVGVRVAVGMAVSVGVAGKVADETVVAVGSWLTDEGRLVGAGSADLESSLGSEGGLAVAASGDSGLWPNATKFCSSQVRDLANLAAKTPVTDRLRA